MASIMNNLPNKNILDLNSTRLIYLTETFLQNRIEHYTSLYTLEYSNSNNDYIITKMKCLIRQELNQYLFKLFKANSHIISTESNLTLSNIAEHISLKFEPIIKEKLEDNIQYAQKFLNQSKISEALL